MSGIFREKSIERVSSPEQLDDYIRVTTPSVWMTLLAILILAAGLLAWNILGKVPATDSSGAQQPIDPISMIID